MHIYISLATVGDHYEADMTSNGIKRFKIVQISIRGLLYRFRAMDMNMIA